MLNIFFRDYYSWAMGNGSYIPFENRYGLCASLDVWYHTQVHTKPIETYGQLARQLAESFVSAGLDAMMPFHDNGNLYNQECDAGLCHQNTRRINFLEMKLAGALLKEFYEHYVIAAENNEQYARSSGLCHLLVNYSEKVHPEPHMRQIGYRALNIQKRNFGGSVYPFNRDSNEYITEYITELAHKNTFRLKFVKEQLCKLSATN